jgi:hypothetical protein
MPGNTLGEGLPKIRASWLCCIQALIWGRPCSSSGYLTLKHKWLLENPMRGYVTLHPKCNIHSKPVMTKLWMNYNWVDLPRPHLKIKHFFLSSFYYCLTLWNHNDFHNSDEKIMPTKTTQTKTKICTNMNETSRLVCKFELKRIECWVSQRERTVMKSYICNDVALGCFHICQM